MGRSLLTTLPSDTGEQLLGFLGPADRAAVRQTGRAAMRWSPPPSTVVRVLASSCPVPWLAERRAAALSATTAGGSPQRHWRRAVRTVRFVGHRHEVYPDVFYRTSRSAVGPDATEARAMAAWVAAAFPKASTVVVPFWMHPARDWPLAPPVVVPEEDAAIGADGVDPASKAGTRLRWKVRRYSDPPLPDSADLLARVARGGTLTVTEPLYVEDEEFTDANADAEDPVLPFQEHDEELPVSAQCARLRLPVRVRLESCAWPPAAAADSVRIRHPRDVIPWLAGEIGGSSAGVCLAARLTVSIEHPTDRLVRTLCGRDWPRLRTVTLSQNTWQPDPPWDLLQGMSWALAHSGVETLKISVPYRPSGARRAVVAGELDAVLRWRRAERLPAVAVRYHGTDCPLLRYLLAQPATALRVTVVHVSHELGTPTRATEPLWHALDRHGCLRVVWLDYHGHPHALDRAAWANSPHLALLRVEDRPHTAPCPVMDDDGTDSTQTESENEDEDGSTGWGSDDGSDDGSEEPSPKRPRRQP